MRTTVVVDGFTYEGKWLTNDPRGGLHVIGPVEHKRPTHGFYRDGEWDDDSGPQGRITVRFRRWWKAAELIRSEFDEFRASQQAAV